MAGLHCWWERMNIDIPTFIDNIYTNTNIHNYFILLLFLLFILLVETVAKKGTSCKCWDTSMLKIMMHL